VIPVAAEATLALDLRASRRLLAVTVAPSTAFTTPAGNQTNRFPTGPDGYRVTDPLKVQTPLRAISRSSPRSAATASGDCTRQPERDSTPPTSPS
jgi:di/tricarboxylate transporter